jgi:hypothetical protein
MSVETEPTKETPKLDFQAIKAQAAATRQNRPKRGQWLLVLGGLLLFVGLLALAVLALRGSRTAITPFNPPSNTDVTIAALPSPPPLIKCLVADPVDYQNLFAATSKGVFSSSDGGKTWTNISTNSALSGVTVSALALDGNDSERPLYAGTLGAGLFKSSDGGKTWNNLGLAGRDIATLAAYQGHVYVGVRGTFATVYASSDSGQTFITPIKGQLPNLVDVRTLAIDPVNPQLVYIGTAYVDGLSFPDYGRVKFSEDGGKTWRNLGHWQAPPSITNSSPTKASLDSQTEVSILLAVTSSRIYAGNGQALFQLSPDQTTWQPVSAGLPQAGVLDVASDPQVPSVVYADTTDGFYRNSDGTNWVKLGAASKAPLLADPASSVPALIAANTHNNAISINNLNSTYLYALDTGGQLISYENRDFGNGKLAPLPGATPLPDFSAFGGINPADPLDPPTDNDPNRIYFKETSHFISGGFYGYWKQNGGLATFGLPLTEEYSEFDASHNITLTVQYFERAKFEYHAEATADRHVQLALIGREATAGKYYVPGRYIPNNSKQQYFPATSHTLRGVFYQFWVNNGGLGRFGLPLTEELSETQSDGTRLTVQYFERAKLEYITAKNGPVQISLLGRQVLVQKGWLKK